MTVFWNSHFRRGYALVSVNAMTMNPEIEVASDLLHAKLIKSIALRIISINLLGWSQFVDGRYRSCFV
jgi:hypothetical protein